MRLSLAAAVALATSGALATALPTAPPAGVRIPLARRTRFTDANGFVDLERLRDHVAAIETKVARGLKAFEANTGAKHPLDDGSLHAKLAKRAAGSLHHAKRATGSVALTDDDDGDLWQGGITVGTPAKAFTVDFDTGSSDLFLPGSTCRVNCAGHTLYNTAASSTAKTTRASFSLAFGDGSTVEGTVFTDTVSVGGLTATTQAVGDSSQYSAGFALDEFPPDGLMGMGFEQISVFGASPVFNTLVAQGKTTASTFGVKLATTGSELFLGGADTTKFTGALTNVPLTTVGFWELTLGSFNANGRATTSNIDAIVDTGTTLIVTDQATAAALFAGVPGAADASRTAGAGFFTFPCNANPNVSLTFGGKSFPVSLDTFNLGVLTGNECVGGLMGSTGLPFTVVGDVFLQNVYTVFDVGNEQVGFATLA